MASGTGMANRARILLGSKLSPTELENIVAEDIFEAAWQGQEWAWTVINETVDYLTIAIVNLAASFDPELIVLGGGTSRYADLLLEPITRRLAGTMPTLPKLVVSNLGLRATVMGAVTNVLHNTSNYYFVHKLS
jgi:glucokinase